MKDLIKIFIVFCMFVGCSPVDSKKTIIGEWETQYEGVTHFLTLYENKTGEIGGEGMKTEKIKWEIYRDEFKVTLQKDQNKNQRTPVVMAKLVDNELICRQPDNPQAGVLKLQRKRRNLTNEKDNK
jgi:hypothetical protein